MASMPLWRCPVCGQRFVSSNMPHSCDVMALDAFFATAEPGLRDLFDHLVAAARECGDVTVNATRSRVTLQARGPFAGIERPRKDHLPAYFVLTTPIRQAAPAAARGRRCRAQALAGPGLPGRAQRHVTDPDWRRLREPPGWVHLPREVAEAIARGEDPSIVR